jgi:hypothetical protein
MAGAGAVRIGESPHEPWPWQLAVLSLLALVCALAGLHAARPISNPDFGWHVAVGRWILEHAAVPDSDPFTHTARAAPMVAHQWLSQSLYAATIQAVDVLGLRIGNGLLAAALVAILYGWLRRAGTGSAIALFGVVLWATIAESRLQLRPHMFNILGFMLAYGALFVLRPRLTKAQLAGFFAFTILWINMHSGAVLFPALVCLYALTATVEQRLLGRSPSDDALGEGSLTRLWALAGLTLAATFISPNHFHIVPYVIESGQINAGLSVEWFSIASSRAAAVHGYLFFACFWSLSALVAIIGWQRRHTIPLAHLAVVLAVAALPLVSQRFSWTSFVSVIFVAESLEKVARGSKRAAGIRVACTAAALCLAIATFALSLDAARLRHWLSADGNFRGELFPSAAMTFLAQTSLQGNLFNANKWGGYILFRTHQRYPVFVDGRWVTIGEQVVRDSDAISHRRPGSSELLDHYRIEILLVHRGWMSEELLSSGLWWPAFENVNSGVYLRRGPSLDANLDRAADYYLAHGVPFDRQTGFDEQQALAANPSWASSMRVRRLHLDQFGEHGVRAAGAAPRWVPGW